MSMQIKKYGNSFVIKTIEGFEIEFDKIKIDDNDNEIVLCCDNKVSARIAYTYPLYEEFIKKWKKAKRFNMFF